MKKLIISFSEKFFKKDSDCLDVAYQLTALRKRLENRYPNTLIKIQTVDDQSKKYLTYDKENSNER